MSTTDERRPGGNGTANKAIDGAEAILADTLANADWWWRDCAERAVTWWAEARVEFSADDVRALGVPEPDHPNRWGALFATFRGRGLIAPVGYRTSTRKARHGGVLRVWRGVPGGVGRSLRAALVARDALADALDAAGGGESR